MTVEFLVLMNQQLTATLSLTLLIGFAALFTLDILSRLGVNNSYIIFAAVMIVCYGTGYFIVSRIK